MARKNKTGLPAGCCWTTDRHGKRRLRYFGHGFSLYFKSPFASPEFALEYAAALARNESLPARQPIGATRTVPGTIGALVVSYFELILPLKDQDTKATRRRILEKFRAEHGHRSVAGATPGLLEMIVLQKAKHTPHAANNLRKALRDLFRHAVRLGLRADNPMLTVTRIKTSSHGHHTWIAAELAQYRAHWPLGTQQRLVFELAMELATRRGEIVRIGPQHERPVTEDAPHGLLDLRRLKGSADTIIPISAELRAAIDACAPFGGLTYLATKNGTARSSKALSGDFRAWCDAAGLPKRCRLHGLKKSSLTELANSGASVKEMQAISGHRSLAILQTYINRADQASLAVKAMAKRAQVRTGRHERTGGVEQNGSKHSPTFGPNISPTAEITGEDADAGGPGRTNTKSQNKGLRWQTPLNVTTEPKRLLTALANARAWRSRALLLRSPGEWHLAGHLAEAAGLR